MWQRLDQLRRPLVLLTLVYLFVLWIYLSEENMLRSELLQRQYNLALSTKSPYHAKTVEYSARSNSALKLIQVQYIIRHGARYPTINEMQRFSLVYEMLEGHVPPYWLKYDLINQELAASLADNGKREIQGIATRTAVRYSHILRASKGWEKNIVFLSSDISRAYESAEVFREYIGLGEQKNPIRVMARANDTMLAMKNTCPRWNIEKTRASNEVDRENNTFEKVYRDELLAHFTGYFSAHVGVQDIAALYSLCGYDMSLYGESSHWCSLFNERITMLMELRSDLRYSRVYGPDGALINRQIACNLLTEIFKHIKEVSNGQSSEYYQEVFMFGHAETIMFVSTMLGLEGSIGETVAVSANISESQMYRRGFRTTLLTPFSANIIFEIYTDDIGNRYIRLLLNEASILIPGCSSYFCSVDKLVGTILKTNLNCDFHALCKV